MARCTHLDSVKITELPDAVDGCVDRLATGDPWCHLCICLTCLTGYRTKFAPHAGEPS